VAGIVFSALYSPLYCPIEVTQPFKPFTKKERCPVCCLI